MYRNVVTLCTRDTMQEHFDHQKLTVRACTALALQGVSAHTMAQQGYSCAGFELHPEPSAADIYVDDL
jgi:hypothetical protein